MGLPIMLLSFFDAASRRREWKGDAKASETQLVLDICAFDPLTLEPYPYP